MTGRYEMLVEQNAEVPMRDGAILRANVYRPDADARFPVINLAELGRLDESQETVARLLELEPNLTLSVLRGRAPIADPKLMDLFLNGLRKAGPLDCGTVGLQKLEEPQEAGHQKTVRVPFGCRSAAILPSEGLRTTYVLVRRSCGKGGNRWGRGRKHDRRYYRRTAQHAAQRKQLRRGHAGSASRASGPPSGPK